MRILMLAQFYPPILGGTEQHVQALNHELVARGHDVAVATIWHKGQTSFEIDAGVRIYRIRSSMQRLPWLFGDERRHAPPFPDPELMLELQRIMQNEQPQIVHAHNWLARSFLPLKRRNKARLVVSLHDYSLVCAKQALMYHKAPCSGPGTLKCLDCAVPHYGLMRGAPTVLSNRVMGHVERNTTDMFLAVSQAVAERNGLPGSHRPFRVIPNFISDDLGNRSGSAQATTAAYLAQLPDEDYLLYVGALTHEKGIEVLLCAYKKLVNDCVGSTLSVPPLVLIGYQTPDWHMPELDDAHKIFVFKDWPHAAVMEAWKRCSIALIPSIWSEPFGIVALEAMSMGKPVIASRIGGLQDIVAEHETGLLFPPGDASALQKALQSLLSDKAKREHMGRKGKERVKMFQAKVIVPRIEQVYRDLLSI